MLETDALKEKLEMEIHRFARPPEELSSGDPYFEQLQTMLAIREELENIPLCDIQRDMLLAMENVLESAWLFRNTPRPGSLHESEQYQRSGVLLPSGQRRRVSGRSAL